MRLKILLQTSGPATADEQRKLALGVGQIVSRTTQVRFDGDRAASYELLSVPIERLPKNGAIELFDVHALAASGRLALGSAVETVTWVAADAEIASHLGVPAGRLVMLLDRVIKTDTGLPIEWRRAFALAGGRAP